MAVEAPLEGLSPRAVGPQVVPRVAAAAQQVVPLRGVRGHLRLARILQIIAKSCEALVHQGIGVRCHPELQGPLVLFILSRGNSSLRCIELSLPRASLNKSCQSEKM